MKPQMRQNTRFAAMLLLALISCACTPDELTESDYFGPSYRLDGESVQPTDAKAENDDTTPSFTDTETSETGSTLDTAVPPADTSLTDITPEDTTTTAADSTDDVVPTDDGVSSPDACTPNCTNKDCGDDGCGGICGICSAGNECNNLNLCVPECEEQCTGKFCGPDGCGGTCGSCESGFECGPDGKCYDVTCVPNCVGKVCGDDGCNGTCGDCIFGDLCEDGQCVTGPCSGIPESTGTCEDGQVVKCVNGEKIVENCTAIPGYTCQWNPNVSEYQCLQTGGCLPNCVTKECGEDGCGGFCGICPSGWPCQAGQCTPVEGGQCGYFNTVGTCEADTLYYCDSGTLFIEDCSALGKSCGFDPASQSNQCLD